MIIVYVPGNCTGVWQPLDVGIQRVLKQSMGRSAHKDIVDETMAYLDSGITTFKLDTTLGTLCNRSVAWLLNAYHDINNKELITKVSRRTFICASHHDLIQLFRLLSFVVLVNLTFRTQA